MVNVSFLLLVRSMLCNTQWLAMLQIPDSILLDEALNAAIAVLPANYNFEVTPLAGSARQNILLRW